jgi:hypothetical protein
MGTAQLTAPFFSHDPPTKCEHQGCARAYVIIRNHVSFLRPSSMSVVPQPIGQGWSGEGLKQRLDPDYAGSLCILAADVFPWPLEHFGKETA